MRRARRWVSSALLAALVALACLMPPASPGECAALLALSARGKPYVFGAQGPDSYDCSGLVRAAFAPLGAELVHSAKLVARDEALRTVESPARLVPGDLLFFDTVPGGGPYDHVGVWIGLNRFVHASSAQGRVVISRFDEDWRACFTLAKRPLPALYGFVRAE